MLVISMSTEPTATSMTGSGTPMSTRSALNNCRHTSKSHKMYAAKRPHLHVPKGRNCEAQIVPKKQEVNPLLFLQRRELEVFQLLIDVVELFIDAFCNVT